MHSDNYIPFLDLVAPHAELKEELTAVFSEALQSASFVGGEMVETFENSFAEFCGARHAVAASSGTDALRFALIAAGIEAGQVVITVPNTFIATTEAISQAGALFEFVDIDESTYTMSVDKLREYVERHCARNSDGRLISRKYGRVVKAVVPVHLYGQVADMDGIMQLAEENDLTIIEDACQAHGAEYFSRRHNRWMRAGSIGAAAAFSFYPGKNLGACGEGGAVTTNDAAIADKVRMLRDHGQSKKYYHGMEGYNGRLDAIQAGILQAKLAHLQRWNELRQERAADYRRMLAGCADVIVPTEPGWSHPVYHLFVIRTADRDGLMKHLKSRGIGTGIHYPVPLHAQKAYRELNYLPMDFPVTSLLARQILSMPMYPQLTSEQQSIVTAETMEFLGQAGLRVPVGIDSGLERIGVTA